MPVVDRDLLLKFLSNNAVTTSMVTGAMKPMEPLFNAAEYGHLCYVGASAVLNDWVKTAAGKALGCTVAEARFIPLDKPFERPDWMPAGLARMTANAAMMKLVNDGNSPSAFDHALAQFRQPSTVTQAQKILGSWLDERLRHCLMNALAPVMRRYIEPLADAAIAHLAIRVISNTLHTYLWRVIIGDQAAVAAMMPTVKLLHEICPWAVIGPTDSGGHVVTALVHKLKAPTP